MALLLEGRVDLRMVGELIIGEDEAGQRVGVTRHQFYCLLARAADLAQQIAHAEGMDQIPGRECGGHQAARS